jgi:hypothetical protein
MGTQQGHSGPSVVPAGVSLASSHTAAAAAPTDQLVANAVDGAIHVETTAGAPKIWARVNGVWKSAALS